MRKQEPGLVGPHLSRRPISGENLAGGEKHGDRHGNGSEIVPSKGNSHMGAREMHPSSNKGTKICDKFHKSWRTHRVHERTCPNHEVFRVMALRKKSSVLDQNLVEPKGRI
jgi:hypothetical protein